MPRAEYLDQALRNQCDALAVVQSASYSVPSAPDEELSAQTENLERSAEDTAPREYRPLERTGRDRPVPTVGIAVQAVREASLPAATAAESCLCLIHENPARDPYCRHKMLAEDSCARWMPIHGVG